MNNITAIVKREMKSYFTSPIAYIVITVFLLIIGYFFTNTLFLENQASLRSVFNMIPLIFVFFIPAITMGLISEEKQTDTIELLTTMPIRDSEIVLGKFFGALIFLAIAIFLTLPYPITLYSLGNPETGTVIGGYLGLLFMGGAYIAIGIFASSLTKDQIVAFIISFLFVFILFVLDKVLIFMPSFLSGVLEYLSIGYHFSNISKGILDSRDVVYYLSIMLLFLYWSVKIIESRK